MYHNHVLIVQIMLLVSVIESVVKISFFFRGGAGFLVTSTEQSISKANLCFGEIESSSHLFLLICCIFD